MPLTLSRIAPCRLQYECSRRQCPLDVRSYTLHDVQEMWVNAEIDALVKFTRGLQFPSLQAIRWKNRRIDLKGSAQMERGTMSLNYLCTDGLTRYSIRFEPTRQKWYLEAIDDSGLMQVGEDLPPPTAFPPPSW